MLTPNIVTLDQIIHYLVKSQKNKLEVRTLVVASGVCNDVPFEAIAINDFGCSTSIKLFRSDGKRFSKMESQSVQRRIKFAKPDETFDWRGDPETKKYDYLHDLMCEKYYGKKVYLRVPFSRKDEAKALGAEWDGTAKKWFAYDKSPNLSRVDKYFNRDEP
jgi:hypothetical protein